MKRCTSIVLLAAALLMWLTTASTTLETAVAQRADPSPPSQTPSPATTNVLSPQLQCQGCHASGKTLPYLGGALFHTQPHTDYDSGFHAVALRNGGKGATCLDCHTTDGDMTTILAASDLRSKINRTNIAETCGRCHGDKTTMQGSGISDRPFLSYRESVHAKAIARGNLQAAVCTDCHNSHDILPASNSQSSIARINVPTTCGKCHKTETGQFVQSIHGRASARGVSRSPVCTDCHGIHKIETPFEQATVTASTAVATDSCAKCHEGVALTQEFGVSGERVSSYKESYHGLASQAGSKVVANCSSCHGVHDILPSSDPKSMINTGNLTQTCGQCHVGASENFTKGKIHLTSALTTGEAYTPNMGIMGTRVVRWIYLPLIVFVIGGMVVHNALVWRKKVAEKRKREVRTIVRLTPKQRLQHWLLLSSFILLVFSGFALQYPNSWLAWLLGSSEALRRIIHRIAAVVMLLTGTYHILYLALNPEGRQWVKDMLPRLKDIKDVVQNFGYYLGLKASKPQFARFGYAEKAEYWAVVWGTIIMGLTGLMIWFKIDVFGFLPRWWIDIALAIHFYEAVLASLAIVVWHFYQVIFDPDVYPINLAFLDGRVSEELYKEEHELDYDRIKESERLEAELAASKEAEPLAAEPE
ncbi:MAG: cytochrome b/b6 domain-containing protein [Pyrinomonadaceae bacterium]|nr:cytochrome b/b6 domain-containing protein [Pyrinomonadaceae bacterium]